MPSKYNVTTDIPELNGKVILVTGGNAGLGAATVEALAAHNPSCIYICVRRIDAANTFAATVREKHPKTNLKVLSLDLNSFASVRACAEQFNKESDRLDVLYLNAGVAATSPALTKEGYEHQFGINHMGHALLTQLLLPKLLATQQQVQPDVRIVVVSSVASQTFVPHGLPYEELKTVMADKKPMERYGQSKFANVLFARKLAKEYPMILSTSVHPGTVLTEIWGKATGARLLVWLVWPFIWWTGVDIHTGAKTQLWLGTGPQGEIVNGEYYEPIGKVAQGNPLSHDQKQIDQLWEWTSNELSSNGAPGWPKA